MNWILFAVLGVAAYGGISLMGQLADVGAGSALKAATNLLQPHVLAILLAANLIWAVALYYGLRESKDAIPALIAIGVLTSFAYSVAFLGAGITLARVAGLVLILAGIFLLA